MIRHYVEFVLNPITGKYDIKCNTCPWKPKPKPTREIARRVARGHRDEF